MRYTINSKKLGKKVTFFTGHGTSYIFVNLNGMTDALGDQIHHGGRFTGDAIVFASSKSTDDTLFSARGFASVCRNWWNAYLKRQNNI